MTPARTGADFEKRLRRATVPQDRAEFERREQAAATPKARRVRVVVGSADSIEWLLPARPTLPPKP